jgi:hypothetical protein
MTTFLGLTLGLLGGAAVLVLPVLVSGVWS